MYLDYECSYSVVVSAADRAPLVLAAKLLVWSNTCKLQLELKLI